jgi:hypothetical protein
MSKKQKGLLMAAPIMFLICGISNLTRPGPFQRNALRTLIYWAVIAVIFTIAWALAKTPKSGE